MVRPQAILAWILDMEPRFITADLTLARSMPGMEHLIPLGEESGARALDEAAARAKETADRLAA